MKPYDNNREALAEIVKNLDKRTEIIATGIVRQAIAAMPAPVLDEEGVSKIIEAAVRAMRAILRAESGG